MARPTPEKFKTYGNVFDEFTHRNLFKLATQGIIEEIESPISIGKEANIFTASTKEGESVILKIYRLETCDFNRMYDYIRYDPRYAHLKAKRRSIIFAWAQREFRNLLKAREAGVRVPLPIKCLYNINVLELIGNPAPKLKDDIPEQHVERQAMYEQVITAMKKMFHAGLIHGDLSEFNILNDAGTLTLIDFSQATPLKNPNAMNLLDRDIRNICNFFKKKGVDCDPTQAKRLICGA